MKDKGFGKDILELRRKGHSYRQISETLGCSRAVISYHCKKNNLTDIGLAKPKLSNDLREQIKEYYKTHTTDETAEKFGIGESTVKRYSENKRIILTDEERKKQAYIRVKTYRQRTKEKAVKYKGEKCSICGYNNCVWAMEFHHNNPLEKDFVLSKYSNHSWDIVKLELDKCILVCANCHREIHYNQFINNEM